VQLASGQFGVIRLAYFVTPSIMRNASFNMCYYIQNNKVIIMLEMSDKCKNDQCPTSQKCEITVRTIERRPTPFEEARKMV
jgi:hypothetical protein